MRSSIFPLGCLLFFTATLPAAADDGPTIYKTLCASCHDTGAGRAPTRDVLQAKMSGLAAGDVPKLKLKWAFAFISSGTVIINSGYVQNGMPGNVLLAFTVDGK